MRNIFIRAIVFFLVIVATFAAFIYDFTRELNLIAQVAYIVFFIVVFRHYQKHESIPDYLMLIVKNVELIFDRNIALRFLFIVGALLATVAVIDLITQLVKVIDGLGID